MGSVVVLGEAAAVRGYALAGAVVVAADGADAVRRAWDGLPADVAVVVLTPAAAEALAGMGPGPTGTALTVVMP